jgi:hypothetical protein
LGKTSLFLCFGETLLGALLLNGVKLRLNEIRVWDLVFGECNWHCNQELKMNAETANQSIGVQIFPAQFSTSQVFSS